MSTVTAGRMLSGALLALGLLRGAAAHRLDEYLQATLIGPARDGTDIEVQLTPGVAILPVWMAVIDQDRDGAISAAEQQAYVNRVVRDLELRVDRKPTRLAVTSIEFPSLDAAREGLGTLRIRLHASRGGRELRFENRHLPQVSAYLVNCLAAPAESLVVSRQKRDEAQRSIEFEYSFGGEPLQPPSIWSALQPFWPAALGMLLVARLARLTYRAKFGNRASGTSAS
jgi:hypothetical protein